MDEEYDLPEEDYVCICGAHLPCRHEDSPTHGVGSYFGHPMVVGNEEEARKARLVLKKIRGASSPEIGELWRALVSYGRQP